MASADQRPNWVCVMCSTAPIAGNASRAIELSTKTVPNETAISSSVALDMGATAAIALPPQMAVPAEMRNDSHLLEFLGWTPENVKLLLPPRQWDTRPMVWTIR